MPLINSKFLHILRQSWHDIPADVLEKHTDLVSRVWPDENGTILPIFSHVGYFCINAGPVEVAFEKLGDAEVLAAGLARSSALESDGWDE